MLPVIDKNTILKYDSPGPRYTSYPTAPEWQDHFSQADYRAKLKAFGLSTKTLSVYVHLPFCVSMCTFCACNVVIRPNDQKYAEEYLQHLFAEIDLVREAIGKKALVKQLHWGGGTPNFLSVDQLQRLFYKIKSSFEVDLNQEVAVEIDPRTVTVEKIKVLREAGFNRVSMGVQDFEPQVQGAINRIQPFVKVKAVYDLCRQLGFQSVNFDLIYGLPYQTLQSFRKTVEQVAELKPDRIALYSFAYVPWLKKHQKKIVVDTLPENDLKLDIFLLARNKFLSWGYQAIAMDHFALTEDELAVAYRSGKLYRNFMGYTVKPADEYIGLGMTAIGFLENAFIQNQKTLPDYYAALKERKLPVERGKDLSPDDLRRQWVINSLMCQFKVDSLRFQELFNERFEDYFAAEEGHLAKCLAEGLLEREGQDFRVTELGKIFIRNVCMGFDWYLRQSQGHKKFSKTI